MNKYTYDDIFVGMEESFTVKVTEESMSLFLDLTEDINPLHNDVNYAKELGYKDKVVYGMLTASFLSTLAGVYLPGKNSLIHSVEIKMTKPVFKGDELTVIGTVVEKSESVPVFMMKVSIKNQIGELVLRGRMQIGVLNERK